MADNLEIKSKLSPSDFGAPVLSKDPETGKFKSFGVDYEGEMVWNNNEKWYQSWVAGEVIPGSIIMKRVQRVRNVLDEKGNPIIENGRKKTEVVAGEFVWQLSNLKTKGQLQNEDDILVWSRARQYSIKSRIITERNKYVEAAQKSVEAAQLSPEQEKELDKLFEDIVF